MSEKNVVSRNVAIALGIASIVFLIVLVGTYVSLSEVISSKNSQIDSLSSQNLNLTDIVNLSKSETWVNSQTVNQKAGSHVNWTFSASYAGYVSVWVQSSTTDRTFVRVIYSSHGVDFNEVITVGASGTAVFPVLPSSNIEIRVGNYNVVLGATETVTITYNY